MTMILLHNPVASAYRLERVHMFPGRYLGEEEFDRIQDYADARLTYLLQGKHIGIVQGLEINLGPNGVDAAGFTVNPGIALAGNGQVLGLYYPLRAQWQVLIDGYLSSAMADTATGVYYLMLQRTSRNIDSADVAPCQRAEFDPSRDSRLVVAGSLFLHKLSITPETADPASPQHRSRERIENWVAANCVDGAFLSSLGTCVPLALLAIRPNTTGGFVVDWLSQESGRYEALPNSGYRVLLNQTSAAMRRVMQKAEQEEIATGDLPAYLKNNLNLDFLPAAGQLPMQWLQNPADTTPSLLWLPNYIGVDMVPVPEEAVLELINRHIARRVIDVRRPAGDKIRLLLAVNEPDYRNDLLDIPQTDAKLEKDIFRYFMRAYDAWRRWRGQFDRLYYLMEGSALSAEQAAVLDLPEPELAPPPPQTVFDALINEADTQLQDPEQPGTPYPYSEGVPSQPAFYSDWLTPSEAGPVPPPAASPTRDGLIVQYAITQERIEAAENKIRATRTRLEKTRDFLLIERQQLDSQTVALAALAGGVAGDGAGLQVARWLPYTEYTPLEDDETTETAATATTTSNSGSSAMLSANTAYTLTKSIAGTTSSTSSKSQTFGSKMLGASLITSTAQAKLQLSKPQTFSAFELGINQERLKQLSQMAKTVVAKPAFQAKEYRFSVLDHISPEINEYSKAYYGMVDLLKTLTDLFDATDAASLRARLKRIGGIGTTETADTNIPADQITRGKLEAPEAIEKRLDKAAQVTDDDGNPVTDNQGRPIIDYKKRNSLAVKARYEALFKAGKVLTQWIAITENRYNNIERKLEGLMRQHAALIVQLEKLAAMIQVARKELETVDGLRVEQLGDYGVAQRLLDEDWRRIYTVNQDRTRILTTGLRGLYYVRVRPTPISNPLADPLELRYGTSSDIVPGCDWTEDVQLPEELETFFDAVCEIPMADWTALRDLIHKIPAMWRFDYLNQLRQSRFTARATKIQTAVNAGSLRARLKTVHQQTQMVLQRWSLCNLPQLKANIKQIQEKAANVLSLEDLNAMQAGLLRKPAHDLREKLETCQYCLLDKLNQLPPSLRLQWAQLAEDDRLRVENVAWWPGLENAERDDFNATRTVAELIAWWFRQLDADASADSRSAMRNIVRATLIHASLGDPTEIIRGKVHVPPRTAAVGERLHVKLNRMPNPGTCLQLIDTQQRVVALLTVEDHNEQSTQVQIVNLVQKDITINTRYSVVANKRTAQLL